MTRWIVTHGLIAGVAAASTLVVVDVLLAGAQPGLLAHFVFSLLVALGLTAVVAASPEVSRTPWSIHAAGLVAGLLAWLHGVYIVLPALGYDALSSSTNATMQLTAHVAVFGVGVAGWLEAKRPRGGLATRKLARVLATAGSA